MQLQQVVCFLAVVDHKGVNAAAHALGSAPPTVSLAVRGLERDLGTELFHRLGRGMVLSSAGRALVGPARRIVRGVVAAEGAVADAAGRLRGRLDVSTVSGLSVEPLAPLVGAFRREFPGVSLRIGDLPDEAAAASLIRDGHCEIALCYLPAPDSADMTVCELGVQEMWLVLPPGSAPPAEEPVKLSRLPDEPYVVVPRGGSRADQIEEIFAAEGHLLRPAAVLHQREARLPFVLAGVGATLFERSTAQVAAARGAVVSATDPPISQACGLIYQPGGLSPAGEAFIEMARESAPGASDRQPPAAPMPPGTPAPA
ncbi:MAG TPA: LysR family transcriptional regulator [Pseudonocardia sp.]|nr:LysR family transcriptional regulator [Pseudonocardia sp.]